MFQRIIERALEIQGENRRSAAAPAQAAPKRATAAKSTKTAKTKK
jgi:hypothetical protein